MTASTSTVMPEETIWPRTRSAMKAVRPKKAKGIRTKPASVTSLNPRIVTKTCTARMKKARTTISPGGGWRKAREILWRFDHDRKQHIERHGRDRSEEHPSELQSLMRISYAVFCSKKNTTKSSTRPQSS